MVLPEPGHGGDLFCNMLNFFFSIIFPTLRALGVSNPELGLVPAVAPPADGTIINEATAQQSWWSGNGDAWLICCAEVVDFHRILLILQRSGVERAAAGGVARK